MRPLPGSEGEGEYTPPLTAEQCQEVRVKILSGYDPPAEEFKKLLESLVYYSRANYAKTVKARKEAEGAARGNRSTKPTVSQQEFIADYD